MANYDTDEYRSTKQKLKLIGTVLILIGAAVLVYGGFTLFNALTSFGDLTSGDFGNQTGDFMGSFFIGGISAVFGFAILVFGFQLVLTAHARAITKYTAIETAPAATIMTEAIATGFSRGMKGGGIGISSNEREVIRIKCRNCGYLESEDATYCSKCGEQI